MAADGQGNVPAGAAVGQVIRGKYRVDRVLGEGGMGCVVLARHVALETKVAIKVLLPALLANKEAVARFAREARAAARIQSPHVARVVDVGALDDGLPFMVMEYLEGSDLARVLAARGPLPVDHAVDVILQASEGLAEAHTLGIIHRDLKPANLFCARRPDGTTTIKVLDFGISKVEGGADHAMTRTSMMMGSPFYMSPEQMESSRSVDLRTDIWALGVILFELVTGQTPFRGESVPELFVQVSTRPPTDLGALRPDAPPGLDHVIARCLEKDRNKRFGSVAELAAALAPYAAGRAAGPITMPPAGQSTTVPPARNNAPAIVLAVVGAAMVLGVAGLIVALRRPAAETAPPAPTGIAVTAAPTAVPPSPAVSLVPPDPSIAPNDPALEPSATTAPPAATAVHFGSPGAAVLGAGGAGHKGVPSAVAAKPAPGCDPNYTVDANGEKHFKPACFH